MRRTLPILAAAGLIAGTTVVPMLAAQDAPRPPVDRMPLSAGWLGIAFSGDDTIVVRRVAPGSPAARAGIEAGDTIVLVDDEPATARGLGALAQRLEPGDTVRVRVRRGDGEATRVLVAEPRPGRLFSVGPPGRSVIISSDSLLHRVRIHLDSMSVALDSAGVLMVRPDSLLVRMRRMDELRHTARLRSDSARRALRARMDSLRRAMREHRHALDSLVHTERVRISRGDTVLVRGRLRRSPVHTIVIGRRAVAGAELTPLNPGLARHFRGADTGLLVLRVAPATPAARAGLEAGDIVVAVNDVAVESVAALRRALLRARAEGRPLRFEVVRQGERETLRFEP